jgi:phosphomannomutase/phosphomannomutase/phosphoglucomutase
MQVTASIFKAYDIRGQLGDELNEQIAYRIGRAYAQYLNAKNVVVGGDARATSESLKRSLAQGMMDAGCNVIDLGMTGTEEVYFAAFYLDVDGGIEVTASHNPIDFNGMKLVKRDARPIIGDTGLKDIQHLAETQAFNAPKEKGQLSQQNLREAYLQHLLGYIGPTKLKPLKLLVNAGNGAAGPTIDGLEAELQQRGVPVTFIKVTPPARPRIPQRHPQPAVGEKPASHCLGRY